MTYSNVQAVRLVLVGFIDPATNGDDPDLTPAMLTDAQIEYEIGNADGHIDSILRRRFVLPLPDPVPLVIKNLSTDMAASLCDMTFRGSREYPNEFSPARLRYQRGQEILMHIANGDYPLYNPGEGPDMVGDESIVINPYKGDILLSTDVFPRGNSPDRIAGGEYSQIALIHAPYYRDWSHY